MRISLREAGRIVGAEETEIGVRALELAQAPLVLASRGVVERHDALERGEEGRTRRALGVHLLRAEVRIAAVQEPTTLVAHRNHRVTAGVAMGR